MFQRVLQPHSWILLSPNISGEKKGSQRQRQRRWEQRKEEWKYLKRLSILLNPHWDNTYQGCSLLFEVHAHPVLMLNYVWNFTHMLTRDKQQIFYCLNLAKPSVCSRFDFLSCTWQLWMFADSKLRNILRPQHTEILQHDVRTLLTAHSWEPLGHFMLNEWFDDKRLKSSYCSEPWTELLF